MSAWGGIASLQFSLSAVWTGARNRGFSLSDLSRWMSAQSAALAGLASRKGKLAPGYDADLIVFDPDAKEDVTAASVLHRHRLSPYVGLQLRGRTLETYVRGIKVYDRGTFSTPQGDLL